MTNATKLQLLKEAKLRKAVAKAAAAEQAAEAAASSRNSSIQGPLEEHFRELCRQHGCGFAFSFCINARAERAMALSSLPDLLQSPVGRPRVELPVALLEARPACKYHEIVKCDPQAMSLHNDLVELQDFIPSISFSSRTPTAPQNGPSAVLLHQNWKCNFK